MLGCRDDSAFRGADLIEQLEEVSGRPMMASTTLYVQDEIVPTPKWNIVAGLRYDNFKVNLTNNRTGAKFSATDNLVAPRLAVIHKPVETFSVYASYDLTYQPRAGDQLSSLSATNDSLDPEEFTNFEIGAKWDASLSLALTPRCSDWSVPTSPSLIPPIRPIAFHNETCSSATPPGASLSAPSRIGRASLHRPGTCRRLLHVH
jgi:hypothetical protein